MPKNTDGLKQGKKFEPGISGNPNGRPRSVKSRLQDAGIELLGESERLDIETKRNIWETVQSMPTDEIVSTYISNKKNGKDIPVTGIPTFVQTLVSALLSDRKKGELKNTLQIETWLYGKTADPQTVVNNNFAPVIVEVAGATRPPITSEDDIDDELNE